MTTLYYFNGHTYAIAETANTWAAASASASSYFAHLATVGSLAENDAIYSFSVLAGTSSTAPSAPDGGGAKYLWLGASDIAVEGAWKWTDGTSVASYTNWGSGFYGTEPDNYLGSQNAMGMGLQSWPQPSGGIGTPGKWNDLNQNNLLLSVCEWDGLVGTAGADILVGTAGNDYLVGMLGNDSIDGGAGFDWAYYNLSPSGVNVNLATGLASGGDGNDTLIRVEAVLGSAVADTLTGDGNDNTLYGAGGNDILNGGEADDTLQGGAGNDTLDGGAGLDFATYYDATGPVAVNLALGTTTGAGVGTDTLIGIELVVGSAYDDQLIGGNPANGSAATDGFELFRGGAGNDTIDGGMGFDRTDYTDSTGAVNVTLGGASAGTASDGWGGTDTLINIEEARGSAYNDILTGSDSGVYESFEGRGGNDIIDGKGGFDRANYSTSPASVTVNLLASAAIDGWGGTDTLINVEGVRGSAFNDLLTGDVQNNYLEGRSGNDIIDGGAGVDTAAYNGNRAYYVVTKTTAGWTVTSSAEGADTLTNIERLKFADAAVAFDISGTGGQAYRVYQAAFNRTPDAGGLGYWIKQMDDGTSLNSVAAGFIASAEFKSVYGANPTNAQIVAKLYDNVLHRPGETAGVNFWVGELNAGSRSVAEVLAGFSESAENQAGLIGVIGNGFAYSPFV
jgi:Ca2+-binding RTX toxin-like protein